MIDYQGNQYARVSEILQQFDTFPSHDPQAVANREAKALIGTMVHDLIEADLKGEFVVIPPICESYFDSYLKWKGSFLPCVIHSETRYYDHKLMFTGKIDLLATTGSGRAPILIDFKTSAQENGCLWPKQAHLYSHLLNVNSIEHHPLFLFVQLDKEGKEPRVYDYMRSTNTMAICYKAVEDFWSKQK